MSSRDNDMLETVNLDDLFGPTSDLGPVDLNMNNPNSFLMSSAPPSSSSSSSIFNNNSGGNNSNTGSTLDATLGFNFDTPSNTSSNNVKFQDDPMPSSSPFASSSSFAPNAPVFGGGSSNTGPASMPYTSTWDGFNRSSSMPSSSSSSSNFDNSGQYKPRLSNIETMTEKLQYIELLKKKRNKGATHIKEYTIDDNLDEMRAVYTQQSNLDKRDAAIKMQQDVLCGVVKMVEGAVRYFNPIDGFSLNGLSDKMEEDMDDYDESFGEVYEQWKDYLIVRPELKIIYGVMITAGSVAFTNFMLHSSGVGGAEILQENPELMRQMKEAAIRKMTRSNPLMANMMNASMERDYDISSSPMGRRKRSHQEDDNNNDDDENIPFGSSRNVNHHNNRKRHFPAFKQQQQQQQQQQQYYETADQQQMNSMYTTGVYDPNVPGVHHELPPELRPVQTDELPGHLFSDRGGNNRYLQTNQQPPNNHGLQSVMNHVIQQQPVDPMFLQAQQQQQQPQIKLAHIPPQPMPMPKPPSSSQENNGDVIPDGGKPIRSKRRKVTTTTADADAGATETTDNSALNSISLHL